jgi:arylformamidase
MNEKSGRTTLSRRTLVAGAAAGTLALASAPASAQRCPPAPARTKGPLVWMNLDQQDLDEAYDQSVYAFNQRFVQERRDERNELMAKVLGKPERVAYGPAEIEKVDIYKTKRPNAAAARRRAPIMRSRSSRPAHISSMSNSTTCRKPTAT